jgi:hypothetical protein
MIFWQVRFALSSISSWRTVDGDFDYESFWNNIVDYFEDVPGPVAQRKVDKLLEWWTRYLLRFERSIPIEYLMLFSERFSEKIIVRI